MRYARLLLVPIAMMLGSITTTGIAAALENGMCCVCECADVGTGCTGALGPNFCDEFFASGCGLTNGSCQGNVVGSPCSAIPECASALAPAPAPAAQAPALTVGALLLTAIAAWRLHRHRSAS